MARSWTAQANRLEKSRKAKEQAREIRDRETRARNRKHAMDHPIRHALSKWGW